MFNLPENGNQVAEGKDDCQEAADPQDKVERVTLDAGHDCWEAALLRRLFCSCICHRDGSW